MGRKPVNETEEENKSPMKNRGGDGEREESNVEIICNDSTVHGVDKTLI